MDKKVSQNRYFCPKCNSKNIVIWEENVIEHLYYIKNNGKQYKKPFSKFYNGAEVLTGLKCMDCYNYVNFNELKEIDKWEVN